MKKTLFTLLTTCFFIFSYAQNINIPDTNFKNYLVNVNCVVIPGQSEPNATVDTNSDGEIQASEAEAVIKLIVIGSTITSAEGIQMFTNLEVLTFIDTSIISLDVSGMTSLTTLTATTNNLLNEMNVDGLTNLIRLEVNYNDLHTIDASQTSAAEFNFTGNPNLTHINIKNGIVNECITLLMGGMDYTCEMFLDLPSLQSVCLDENEINMGYHSSTPQADVQFGTDCEALVSLEDYLANGFTVYPNPAINTITIQAKDTSVIENIKIYNMLGQMIISENKASRGINISHLKSGSYILEINSDKGRTVKNIIKQ